MIVIAALPFVITNRAMAAPAVLKAALNKHNIASVAMDLNNEVYTRVNASANKSQLYDAMMSNNFCDSIVSEYSNLIKFCAKKILDHRPTLIALSVFCINCRPFCHWLCAELRQHTDVPIVLGGPGIRNAWIWLQELKSHNLISDYITGDGEESFVEYVQNKQVAVGLNNPGWSMLPSLQHSVVPDYSDYNFYSYAEPSIPVVDSRGCVQSCEFCDVIEIWKKFQYKSAQEIFDEMMYQNKLYNLYHFDFRSSISNGNLKEFTKLMEMIFNFNKNRFHSEQISWEGSFIVRSSRTEKIWQLMSGTNAYLFLGVESLVDSVRKNLGKNFSNQDLAWTLEQIDKYKIKANILLISGYPTETSEDYASTKQWFIDNQKYASVIKKVQIVPAFIIPNTQLDRKKHQYGIEQNMNFWVNHKTNISRQQRKDHHNELITLAKSLGFTVDV